MADYAEALEEQIGLLRWLHSPDGLEYTRNNYRTGARSRMLEGILQVAEPYYWSPAIGHLLSESEQTLPNVTLAAEDLPGVFGWWWFAEPLPLIGRVRPEAGPVVQGLLPDTLHALLWAKAAFDERRDERQSGGWAHHAGNIERRVVTLGGGGEHHFDGLLIYALTKTSYRKALPGLTWLWGAGKGANDLSLDKAELEYEGGPELYGFDVENQRLHQMTRILAAGFIFCQDVLDTRHQRVDRAARRRLEREHLTPAHILAEPNVRVVTLRRKRHPTEGTPREVDWACQWLVRGFWRDQWYPSLNRHKPKWIAPYWKGPETAPIKPPSVRLFRAVR